MVIQCTLLCLYCSNYKLPSRFVIKSILFGHFRNRFDVVSIDYTFIPNKVIKVVVKWGIMSVTHRSMYSPCKSRKLCSACLLRNGLAGNNQIMTRKALVQSFVSSILYKWCVPFVDRYKSLGLFYKRESL